jgi:nucleoid-associated protein YgaU
MTLPPIRRRGTRRGRASVPAPTTRPPGAQPPLGPPAQAPAVRAPEKVYVVGSPVGRYRESLWEIAEAHLGDGRRYQEIVELNRDRVQADGSRLAMSSLIRPGWVLAMPGDARGPGVETVAPPPGPAARLS